MTDTRPGYLYRAFDADGELLYIGATINPAQRFTTHASSSDWFSEVRAMQVEPFETRDEAFAAEEDAIEAESPKYNRARRGPYTPEARARRAERQREHDEEQAEIDRTTWLTERKIRCGNCDDAPWRLPKGILLTEVECPRCGCVGTLQRVGAAASSLKLVDSEAVA